MVKIPFKTGAGLVAEGTYPVTLVKASEKKTAKGDDMITFQATIKDSETDWDGRSLFRNFVISNDPEKDSSGVIYYLQQALLAFGADDEDVSEDGVDPVAVAKTLYGNKAQATVTHTVDSRDPDKRFSNSEFTPAPF